MAGPQLPAQRATLREAQIVRVARDAAADEAWLARHEPDMLPVAKASRFRDLVNSGNGLGPTRAAMAALPERRGREIAPTSVVGAVAGQGFIAATSSGPSAGSVDQGIGFGERALPSGRRALQRAWEARQLSGTPTRLGGHPPP